MKNEAIATDASPARRFDRRGARAFYRVLVEYGEVRADPDGVLDDHEVARLLDRIPVTTPLELRDRAMFELACSRGLRAEELGKLDLGALDLDPAEAATRSPATPACRRCSCPRRAGGCRAPTSGAVCASGRAMPRCRTAVPCPPP